MLGPHTEAIPVLQRAPSLFPCRKYVLAGSIALRNRWTYPVDVAGLVFTYGLFVFVFSNLWAAACSGRATLAGYDQRQLTWYFIVSELVIFGIGNSAFTALSTDIKTGQVAYTLARPWSFPLKSLSETLGCALSMLGPFAVVGWLVGSANVGIWMPASAAHGAVLLLSILLSLILVFLCQFLLSMTAFWVEENAAFLWIHQKLALVLGTFLPLEFYPAVWRPWLELTPYGWLCYPPARLAAAYDPNQALRLLSGQTAWILGLSIVSSLVFSAGSRRTAVQGG
jgi:ABC-2 type transport system permease protein